MAAKIKRFQPKDKLVKQEQLEQLQSALELFPDLNEKRVSALLWEAKKQANLQEPNTWTFIMIKPEQNRFVVDYLEKKSNRPLKALRLWALLFEYVHKDTGQIMLTRQEMAEQLEIKHNSITNIMSELESINAIIKKKEGRGVTYYMNPTIGTHLSQEDREKAQVKAPPLTVIDGGKE